MKPYQFSNEWFVAAQAPTVWPQLARHLPDTRSFLEIGSWEGRSTVWTVENLAARSGAQITCVDSWQGGEEHDPAAMGGVFARFEQNMAALVANRRAQGGDIAVRPLRGTSTRGLAQLIVEACTFDFVYVDGSHVARDTLTDACMAWPLLKKGGVMVFDDYMWFGSPLLLHRPKPAVDAFTSIFGPELFVLHNGYQVAVQKTS
jgi:predicted O-methyltransferase YrrM